MADEIAHEVRWGCGCHEVNGKLEVECSQTPLQGEVSAARHAAARPFSAKCFRKANANVAEAFTAGPTIVLPNPAPGTGPSATVTVTDLTVADSGNVVTISSDPTE